MSKCKRKAEMQFLRQYSSSLLLQLITKQGSREHIWSSTEGAVRDGTPDVIVS